MSDQNVRDAAWAAAAVAAMLERVRRLCVQELLRMANDLGLR